MVDRVDRLYVALLLWCVLFAATAAQEDAALERRVNHVAEQLRCLVCQNQSIADSHAQLALDLKREARSQLAQGRSEQEVVDFMVLRYGDFVLYRPPFKEITWALWIGPFVVLGGGSAALLYNLRRRALSDDDDDVEQGR